jgi:hypothetical protein
MINSISRLSAAVSRQVETPDRDSVRPVGREQGKQAASGLSVEERRQVDLLQVTDRKVRAHELAHMAAGAGLTGAASFTYQLGPDNQRYAVAGEVSIDISSGGDPKETISRALQIRAAALAPADPSSQDRMVAALASKMENSARLELTNQAGEEGRLAADRRVDEALAAYHAQVDAAQPVGFSAFA